MTDKFMEMNIEVTENNGLETSFAGLIPLLQMCNAMNLPDIIDQSLHVQGEKGFKDHDYIMSLVAMQIVEGSTLDHLAVFKEKFGLNVLPFNIPSPSAGRGYLINFHNAAEESKQKQGSAYIPEENEYLAGFREIHAFCFQQAFNYEASDEHYFGSGCNIHKYEYEECALQLPWRKILRGLQYILL
jgi:hypothetical protein